jgi:hypothetical protein
MYNQNNDQIMKRFFTCLMVALSATVMMAQWQPSDTEAIRLDAEGTSGQSQMKTLRTDDGKIVLSWLRGERVDGVFSYKLHLQVFDADGKAQFGDEGIIVCDKPTRTWTTDYGMALAPNGDVLLAYSDIRNDPDEENVETYVYRYSMDGEPVWGIDGILFPSGKIHETAFSIEDVAPAICVSGDNIYVAANHSEYYREKATEDNWSPSPWFPNQEMPDSIDVNDAHWLLLRLNADGTLATEEPFINDSKIMAMQPAPGGNIYLVYDNLNAGLDGQMINPELVNEWEAPVTIEDRSLSGGFYMPTPLMAINENDNLMLSYRVLASFYGYQVINHLTPDGMTAEEAVSLTGDIDGDAGSAAMGVKENRAMVAWDYAYSGSEKYMKVNVVDDNNYYFWNGDNTYGVTLDFNDNWGFTPVKVIPVADGWVVLYGNSTSWNGANFMVVKMDEFGEVVWTKQICEDNFKSSGFAITYDEKYAYIFYTQETQYDDDWNEIPGSAGMFVMCVQIGDDNPSSVNELPTAGVTKTEIFTIDGRQVTEMVNGVNIIRTTDENGNVTTRKIIK